MIPLPSHAWHLAGTEPGPTTVILGGTHGDELVGIEAVRQLLKIYNFDENAFGTHTREGLRGNLIFAFGNPEAIRLKTRGASGVRDLNRCFLLNDLAKTPSPEDIIDLVRARELAPLLRQAQYAVDLHATSSDSPPFVCLGRASAEHRKLYECLDIPYVLSDPEDVLAHDEGRPGRGTTDDFVERCGGIAIAYETGKEDDLTRVPDVVEDVLRMLRAIGNLQREKPEPARSNPPVFALYRSIHAQQPTFRYAPGMEFGWQRVQAGQLVGTYPDGTEERVAVAGMLVFPKSPAKIQAGKNLYYLAVEQPAP